MRLTSIELSGFKSFAKKTTLEFGSAITGVVGPNGSGKSNIAESFRFVLGEQSMKSMRGRRGEDLIWNGSGAVPRAGRAGVKLVFDNSDRALNLDFDEVAIERVVHRDGQNDYLLNGSQVRLRDIAELLAGANIGASGHHIISQGEADRVLSAGSRERREMLEDALGLTAYLYKREEAQRKLQKSQENMREVEALRRELAPHLKFLMGQVKKIEDAQKLQAELAHLYLDYLKRESVYVRVNEALLKDELEAPEREHTRLEERIAHLRADLDKKGKKDEGTRELMHLEEEARAANSKRESLTRELGRLEGEIAAHSRLSGDLASVPMQEVKHFGEQVIALAEGSRFAELLSLARQFLQKLTPRQSSLPELEEKKKKLEHELHALTAAEEKTGKEVAALRKKIESEKDASRDAERELFQAMATRGELEAKLATLRAGLQAIMREKEALKMEVAEAGALVGRAVVDYEDHVVRDASGSTVSDAEIAEEERSVQADRRKKLERIKIRLEESGAGNAEEVLKEHKETTERDQFLMRELQDLQSSIEKLNLLIEELTKTLQTRFEDGVGKINKEFDAFFKLMFGGGSASLQVVKEKKLRRTGKGLTLESDELRSDLEESDEDTEVEEGVDIAVSLPHKRIKGLHMLSGGERALTSIALIFAMSQVNPPPFLILDETDAALDEANSRRYGDMVETLAKHSQLIVITHNRETMSRAGVLYGITMGSDGASKLLSVKFEDALAVAK